MITVRARFDGQVFVPLEPVEIPVGVCVDVIVMPRETTEEENRHFEEILKQMLEGGPPQPNGE